jgi:hypothetical protein
MALYSGTSTQLTTTRPGSASTLTPCVDEVGSRSSNSAAIRGGPAVVRPTERSVEALSAAVNVRFPSELTYTCEYVLP